MKSRVIREVGSFQRTFVVILDPGEEAFASLTAFTVDDRIGNASLTAIGGSKERP